MELSEITTKDGEVIELGKFTLLVGPNNVGKSQTLKDIHRKLLKGHQAETTLIDSIKLDRPETFEELFDGLDVRVDPMNIGHHTIDSVTSDFEQLNQQSMIRVQLEHQKQQFERRTDLDYTFLEISKFRVFYMDSESRLKIASKSTNYIPEETSPKNLLQALYGSSGEFDEKLKSAFQSTFGMDIRLDYSSGLELRLAVSKEFEQIPEDPRTAYPIMKQYPSIEHQGDGFRSFVAVVLSLLLSKDKVVLLDEPEAFLHPEQARRLGKWISDHVHDFPCQLLVATHNSNFLAGLLSGSQPADIYRLNRSNDVTAFNKITSEATQALSKSPILSSQRVLEGIFSKGVVVCESDTDRIIYNSVAIHEHGNQEILFIHAHNKQTIKDVVKLLKEASIPTVAVIDIDILNSKADLTKVIEAFDSEFDKTEILQLRENVATHIESKSEDDLLVELKAGVTELLSQLEQSEHTLSGAKGALNRIRSDSTKWSQMKMLGVSSLEEPFQTNANDIIEMCKSLGLFIVPVGELEGWIDLQVRKNKWALPALEKISNNDCPDNLVDFVGQLISSVYGEGNS
ncbi:ATP-dependent nuclease [Vibrio aestuarianus]|uniref:ATP-dependent nuclease n=1 Tax=Vibrio aestuarianus TaxID=28171 RepID=UPI0040684EE7